MDFLLLYFSSHLKFIFAFSLHNRLDQAQAAWANLESFNLFRSAALYRIFLDGKYISTLLPMSRRYNLSCHALIFPHRI